MLCRRMRRQALPRKVPVGAPTRQPAWVPQVRREELVETVQSLARLVEQMTVEQAQLRAERDTLADCVRSLQELQQQPPQPTDVQPQARRLYLSTYSCRLSLRDQRRWMPCRAELPQFIGTDLACWFTAPALRDRHRTQQG